MARTHAYRHSDGNQAVPADQFGKETYSKQGKGAGGLRGISRNDEQVDVWVNCFSISSRLSMIMYEMYCDSRMTLTLTSLLLMCSLVKCQGLLGMCALFGCDTVSFSLWEGQAHSHKDVV